MLNYQKAGVDITAAERLVKEIKPLAAKTNRPEVLTGIGPFAGLFALKGYSQPVLVSGTDGVGTKILLAEDLQKYDTIGIDLVAMSVNDILTCGAKPLFFLDYLAVGRIIPHRERQIIAGIVEGCHQAGCALLGGETAQMADVYGKTGFDLAGFTVGVVEKKKIINGSKIKAGDVLLGLASSGLHSNGYSLVRKLFSPKEILSQKATLGRKLLTPTRIYVQPILEVLKSFRVKGIAHITGGGLLGNIPRILPKKTTAVLQKGTWPVPAIFPEIQKRAGLSESEMAATFNLGLGLVLVARATEAKKILSFLTKKGEPAWVVGQIEFSRQVACKIV